MRSNLKRLKLAKLIALVKDIITDKGVLTLEGEIEVGAEVFMVSEFGELEPASDGVYESSELIITVSGGTISEIQEKTPTEIPVTEDVVLEDDIISDPLPVAEVIDEAANLQERIAELENLLAEKDNKIAELENLLAEYKAKEEIVEEPIEVIEKKEQKLSRIEEKRSNAFRYLPRDRK